MVKVSETYRLRCRNGVWYYRRRVPDHLVASIGKAVIQFSLKTKSKANAQKLREAWDVRWSGEFSKAEQALAETTPSFHSPFGLGLSETEALRLVREYVVQADDRWRKRPPNDRAATE